MKEHKGLSATTIAFMYLAMIMGAGFSSGRESWQYFGVFGSKGYSGTLLAAMGFVVFSYMFTYIARSKDTDNLGAMISPFDNNVIIDLIGWIMAIIYYTLIMSMSAAGSSLLSQQFGFPEGLGGAIIVVLVLFTVLGNYERMARIFNRVVPLLFITTISTIILVIASNDIVQSGVTEGYKPGTMSQNWFISGIVFMSYNGIGMVSTSGSCAVRAKNRKAAYAGPAAGSVLLGLMLILLLNAILKDMAFVSAQDLPMLAFAKNISPLLSVAYSIVLYAAIYATASSTFYGFSTKLKEGRYKKYILIVLAAAGYLVGRLGYKLLVEYLYAPQGYIGMVFLALVVINYIKELRSNRKLCI